MRVVLAMVCLGGCSFTPGSLSTTRDASPAGDDDAPDAPPDVPPQDACALCPANDTAATPEPITGTIELTPDLTNATDDVALSCGGSGGRDLFYELVVPTAQVVYIDTSGSTADTAVAVFAGPCSAAPAEILCSNDPCAPSTYAQLALQLAAGTYCVVLDEATATGDAAVLDVFFAGRPGTELPGASPHQVTGDSCTGINTNAPSCEASANNPNTAEDAMWWFTQCDGSRSVTASTCSGTAYDTILTLRGRISTPSCNDDNCGALNTGSLITETVSGPTLIQLIVDGWNGACGDYTLTVTR